MPLLVDWAVVITHWINLPWGRGHHCNGKLRLGGSRGNNDDEVENANLGSATHGEVRTTDGYSSVAVGSCRSSCLVMINHNNNRRVWRANHWESTMIITSRFALVGLPAAKPCLKSNTGHFKLVSGLDSGECAEAPLMTLRCGCSYSFGELLIASNQLKRG